MLCKVRTYTKCSQCYPTALEIPVRRQLRVLNHFSTQWQVTGAATHTAVSTRDADGSFSSWPKLPQTSIAHLNLVVNEGVGKGMIDRYPLSRVQHQRLLQEILQLAHFFYLILRQPLSPNQLSR